MIEASYRDKARVVDILASSFDMNQSVNYIIPQDAKRKERIQALMDYSFEICHAFGRVMLSENRKACALVLFPDQKKITLKSISRDIKFILSGMGIRNIGKALRRESLIKKKQLKEPVYYLWFIGVEPGCQRQGTGSCLLRELIEDSVNMQKPVYLETSTLGNLPWYERYGFNIYSELDLGYTLYFLKRECNNN